MVIRILSRFFRFSTSRIALLLAVIFMLLPAAEPLDLYGAAKRKSYSSVSRKKGKRSKSKSKSKSKSRSGKRNASKKRKRAAAAAVLYKGDDGTWIHKGRRSIIICRDSLGVVRAMTPFTTNPHAGKGYAGAINEYSRKLQGDGVRVYSLIAPTQGEYYMPDKTSTRGAEQHAIETTAGYLDAAVTPVYVDSIFKCHLDEEIYNRTDHHWSPLGAFYASGALADAAGVGFLPIDRYTTDTVRNYVGTMYKFSGDPEVKSHPEEFVWFIPPGSYNTEYIDYRLSNKKTVGESEKHSGPFFRRFDDGSGAAYCTFMGGDSHTVAVSGTGGTPGRRLLIVKDSFGNAMASNLFGSFEEVHVIDFRYFPHNLIDYIRQHRITDLCFVNCTSIAFAPDTAARLNIMLGHPAARLQTETVAADDDAAEEDEEDEEDLTEEEEEENEEEGEGQEEADTLPCSGKD